MWHKEAGSAFAGMTMEKRFMHALHAWSFAAGFS